MTFFVLKMYFFSVFSHFSNFIFLACRTWQFIWRVSQNKVGNYQLGCGDLQKGCSKLPIKGLYGTAAQVGRDNLTLHRAHLF